MQMSPPTTTMLSIVDRDNGKVIDPSTTFYGCVHLHCAGRFGTQLSTQLTHTILILTKLTTKSCCSSDLGKEGKYGHWQDFLNSKCLNYLTLEIRKDALKPTHVVFPPEFCWFVFIQLIFI